MNVSNEKQDDLDEKQRKKDEEQFFAEWMRIRQQGVQSSGNLAHKYGMSVSQFNILGLLGGMEGQEPCTIGWLSQRMSLDPATVVRAVDYLESQALVARRRDTKDRRQVFVELTEAGHKMQVELRQKAQTRLTTIFRSMSNEGRAALVQGVHEFLTLILRFDESEAQ